MELIPLITTLLSLLKPTEGGNDRRNLRVAKRTYKQLKKEFKKDGFNEEETEMLILLRASILKRTLELT